MAACLTVVHFTAHVFYGTSEGGGVLVLRKLFTGLGREGRAEVSGRRLIDLLLMNFRKAILKRDDQVNKKDKN